MLLVDQRNHGSSTKLAGLEPPHTLQAAAQDLIHFIQVNLSLLLVMAGQDLILNPHC